MSSTSERDSGRLVRKLVLMTSAAVAAVVLVGLGDGAVATWFRAIGGGAAVGFALGILWHARYDDQAVTTVSLRFGLPTLVVIALLGIAGGGINCAARERAADKRATQRAQAEVSRFVAGQGFWAGAPSLLDTTVDRFADALQAGHPPDEGDRQGATMGISEAVTTGAASDKPLDVEGIVCSRYALVPNKFNRSLGFKFIYRLVSPGGRNEIHVVSSGTAPVIVRGSGLAVRGLVAGSGPRRDNGARNTVMLMATSPPNATQVRPATDVDTVCQDAAA